ncbi:MAG TPA: class I adenylate-forming enzyme family protein [Gemmatimonadaceae bacterium]|nr:class I adenylate-forming enzyme family protein [Gemmatimonadaceae bacterium]
MLLHQLFEHTARRTPHKLALVFEGRRCTYGELDRMASHLARALQSRGVRRGDRVTLFLDNTVEAVAGIFAALKCGAVMMPVNPLTRADKLAYLLNDSGASALLTQTELGGAYRDALARNTTVHTCFVASHGAATDRDARSLPFPDLDGSGIPDDPQAIDQDLAAIIYTSGSTGEPKGVMLTHLNMVSAATSVSTYLGIRSDDVILCALPLAFDYGLYQILMGFQHGATVVLERSFAFPVRVVETMSREGVTVFPGVPTMFSLLMNMTSLRERNLSALRAITNTAAALPEAHIRDLRALFPQAKLFSMYGLTECKRVTYLPPEQLDIRPTSVGRGMPNEEVWLVDDAGRRLPNGGQGELVIRGSNVMRGYWRKSDETLNKLRPGPIPGEMILYSGDIFRTDAEGYLYFVARKDDIIKSRGEKVSPREVENALYGMPEVLDAAVIGVPDPVLGEAVKAFVKLKPGASLSEREVIKYCMSKLESFMAPKHVVFVDDLPKTDTGKIRKTGLS